MRIIETYAIANSFSLLELDYMSIAPWLDQYYTKNGFIKTGYSVTWKGVKLVQMQKKLSEVPRD